MSSEVFSQSNFESNFEYYSNKLKEALGNRNMALEILDLEDNFFVKFLRARNYNIEESCRIIESYISLVIKHPQFFETVENYKEILESGIIKMMNQRGLNGETIILFEFGKWNTDHYSIRQIIAFLTCLLEFAVLSDNTQLNGCIGIINTQFMKFQHLSKLGISGIQLASTVMNSLPVKWQKLIFVHENSFTNIIFRLGHQLCGSYLQDKLLVIGKDWGKLEQYVSLDILSENYGGEIKNAKYIGFDEIQLQESKLLKLWQLTKINNM